ncbi:hypothetical protein P3T42_001780 [Paraburkholderia sp. GAS38]
MKTKRAGLLAHRTQSAFVSGLIVLDCPAALRIVCRVGFR